MIELKPEKPAEVHITLNIKRAATGVVETVRMVGHVLPEQQPATEKEQHHGSNSLDRGA